MMLFIIILVTQWLWTWRCAALLCVLALIVLAAVVITSIYFTHHPDAPVFPEIPDSSLEGNCSPEKLFALQHKINIILSRLQNLNLYSAFRIYIYYIYSSICKKRVFCFPRVAYYTLQNTFAFSHREQCPRFRVG